MKNICIIGGGFSGISSAIQLIKKTSNISITILDKNFISKGVAYNPYSNKLLLNVVTSKMSIFDDEPNDFLDWVMSKEPYKNEDREILSQSFLSRKLYGEYLTETWEEYINIAINKNIKLNIFNDTAIDIAINNSIITITTKNNQKIISDYCILATGNDIPKNPNIKNNDFYYSKHYFKNPWDINSVIDINNNLPILIIGNGLTMVDTVLGLIEKGFKGEIYSISPNGFNILSHKHIGLKYTKINDELNTKLSLYELVKLVNKHIKNVRKYGISAEPIIDAIRPHVQEIWQNLSLSEKKLFMSRLRHLWGVARHRIPQHIQEKIQTLRLNNKLHIISGKLINMEDFYSYVGVEYIDKKRNAFNKLKVSRVINCTGPNTIIKDNPEDDFLKQCLIKGIIKQDELNLGICADTKTLKVKNNNDEIHNNLFAIGTLLRGELWETTAINELRKQSEIIVNYIIKNVG
jgi:uncharacterized NAD(P)/FAD-binding protein YdhS